MLHVACVKWGKAYGPEYVNTLFDMVRRNLRAGFPGQFVCLTDDPTGLDECIKIIPLPSGLTGWWNKLYLFAEGIFPQGDRVLYFDLDTAITGPLDQIAAYDGHFAILRDAYRPNGLQSAVMAWEAGRYDFWRNWHQAGCPMDARGDQGFIEDYFGYARDAQWVYASSEVARLQDVLPGKLRSYKVECRTEIPKGTSVVFFHGKPRPHEVKSGWVPEVWKVGGGSGVEWISVSNTDDEILRSNVRNAISLDCQWLKEGTDTSTAIIVGGGPSLADNLFYIRGMQMAGGKVYATGNTYRYLKDHGIQPDAHILLDARPENISFVPGEDGTPRFYASQCDPWVLRAAGDHLRCWHAAMTSYEGLVQDHAGAKVGGGTTVGLKAIAIAYALGHRHLRLFGFDSSYGPSHHAYDQPLNDGEKTVEVHLGGRTFKCAPWMVTQAEDFKELVPLLLQAGCVLRVFGEGLIPHIASLLKPSAVEERAEQLSQWLEHIPNPRGAEIGVFAGELSQRLLRRPDLSLLMIDHWTTTETISDYAQSGDFHATLSQAQQDQFCQAAYDAVSFAGSRAEIFRMTSAEATRHIPDHSLDFVFIDADHSYEGCKADIQAWLPKIKPSGFIAGHDYDHPDFPGFGVKRAVDEIFGTPELGANLTWRVRLAETWRLAS